jgi:hypothetical protein
MERESAKISHGGFVDTEIAATISNSHADINSTESPTYSHSLHEQEMP